MPDHIVTKSLVNKVNGFSLIIVLQEDLTYIGVTQVGPLAVLLE